MNSIADMIHYMRDLGSFLSNRWLDGLLIYQESISEVIDLLSDNYSKDLYCREILYCIINNFLKRPFSHEFVGLISGSARHPITYSKPVDQIKPQFTGLPGHEKLLDYEKRATFLFEQYRYKDKVRIEENDICIDLGANWGDTAIWMAKNGAKEVYAFEIDEDNIRCMLNNLSKSDVYKCVCVIPLAVGDECASKRFFARKDNPGCGKIVDKDDERGKKVPMVTLDKWCADNNVIPTFIKSDIEGGEMAAIKGASNVISTYRPKFAFSIYHSWEDRWLVPLALSQLCQGYDFYVKKTYPDAETVFLGRPR